MQLGHKERLPGPRGERRHAPGRSTRKRQAADGARVALPPERKDGDSRKPCGRSRGGGEAQPSRVQPWP